MDPNTHHEWDRRERGVNREDTQGRAQQEGNLSVCFNVRVALMIGWNTYLRSSGTTAAGTDKPDVDFGEPFGRLCRA